MKTKPHSYQGERVSVTFDLARCIHAGECVRNMPAVFDPNKKPWVQPDNGDAEELLRVVDLCPSGALQAVLGDGSSAAAATDKNTITVEPDGPFYVRGEIHLRAGETDLKETRVALCRCGASQNKPFCDGRHAEADFTDPGKLGTFNPQEPAADGPLQVSTAPNGPLLTAGPCDIYGAGQAQPIRCSRAGLCRCGASANKPFCDGSHKAAGFKAD